MAAGGLRQPLINSARSSPIAASVKQVGHNASAQAAKPDLGDVSPAASERRGLAGLLRRWAAGCCTDAPLVAAPTPASLKVRPTATKSTRQLYV